MDRTAAVDRQDAAALDYASRRWAPEAEPSGRRWSGWEERVEESRGRVE